MPHDLRNTQQPFPLGLTYEPKHKELVKQHWNMTFARQKRMSPLAKRIMARVIDQIRDDDFELREYYQFRISDLAADTKLVNKTLYNHVKGALRELSDISWEFESTDSSEWYIQHLLDTTKAKRVGYKDGIATVLLNPQLAPYFIEVAHYTKYQLSSYMNLKSWYSMRFFEILSAFRDTGVWHPSVDTYRQLMDCWHEKDKWGVVKKAKNGKPKMKYPSTGDLVTYTIAEAYQELAETNLAFDYEVVYEEGGGRRGRPAITGLRFTLKRRPEGIIPSEWYEYPSVMKAVNSLRGWAVTDKNIALYLEDIGTAAAHRLVYEWQLKENSSARIDNRAKYCNAVFVRQGKQAQEKMKDNVRNLS